MGYKIDFGVSGHTNARPVKVETALEGFFLDPTLLLISGQISLFPSEAGELSATFPGHKRSDHSYSCPLHLQTRQLYNVFWVGLAGNFSGSTMQQLQC